MLRLLQYVNLLYVLFYKALTNIICRGYSIASKLFGKLQGVIAHQLTTLAVLYVTALSIAVVV